MDAVVGFEHLQITDMAKHPLNAFCSDVFTVRKIDFVETIKINGYFDNYNILVQCDRQFCKGIIADFGSGEIKILDIGREIT